ncbi:MAG TPA: hypothetical protein VFC16_11390 [Nakamurella sp.]|nr:hypothetical protein [Nakamurella sp.]
MPSLLHLAGPADSSPSMARVAVAMGIPVAFAAPVAVTWLIPPPGASWPILASDTAGSQDRTMAANATSWSRPATGAPAR